MAKMMKKGSDTKYAPPAKTKVSVMGKGGKKK